MNEFKTAVILAGGKSKRMGFDKQLLTINKELLINRTRQKLRAEFEDILIVTNTPEYYRSFDGRVISDEIENAGPLSGIFSGLRAAKSRYAYFIACDMPNINLNYIRFMKNRLAASRAAACVTRCGEWIEPFNAFYARDIIDAIKRDLTENKTSIFYLIQKINCNYISEPEARRFSPRWHMFTNLNTKEELNAYLVNLALNR